METFSTLGDMLMRRYVVDFVAQSIKTKGGLAYHANRLKPLHPDLACPRCLGGGFENGNQGKCFACQGYKIPAIPWSEVKDEQSREEVQGSGSDSEGAALPHLQGSGQGFAIFNSSKRVRSVPALHRAGRGAYSAGRAGK